MNDKENLQDAVAALLIEAIRVQAKKEKEQNERDGSNSDTSE